MFLEEVVKDVLHTYPEVRPEKMTFIVPNKRAVVFLKRYFSQHIGQVCQAPTFISMRQWVEKVADYQVIPPMRLLFELYETYSSNCQEPDDFETFIGWGQTLLQDFNEIDQYLINPKDIFPYIKAIKEVEHWSLEPELTPIQQKHLAFWNSLGNYYYAFSEKLTYQKKGYQGFIYRKATEQIQSYIEKSGDKLHIFAGFNALTQSEEQLIQSILLSIPSEIYWDIDQYFISDNQHDAGYFIRKYFSSWKYYNNRQPKWIGDNFANEKHIQIVGVPKNTNQAHYLGKSIAQIPDQQRENTAIILADENLLLPVLQSIDQQESPINITMGYPLKQTPISDVFGAFFKLYNSSKWYYKEVLNLLQQPLLQELFSKDYVGLTISKIRQRNWTYLSKNQLIEFAENQDTEILNILFSETKNITANELIEQCFQLIFHLKKYLEQSKEENILLLEYLYHYYQLFNQLHDLQTQFSFLTSPKVLSYLYNDLLIKQTLDFQGEPLEGLQLMGLLESQNLDFENIFIISVNEGTLPVGKGANSFIPFDVKTNLGLPTYKQRDAIFTYHFYRLIQRAKNIHLIYNIDMDNLKGGEKSRFVLQLSTSKMPQWIISETILAPQVNMLPYNKLIISKEDDILSRLKEKATEKGFSPSALTTYIRNPIDFYLQNILKIREEDDVEEIIEARTFGNIVHATLEQLYTPYINKKLSTEAINDMKEKVSVLIDKNFRELYKDESNNVGKNYLIFNVIKEYVERFLEQEKKEVEKREKEGDSITILALEKKLQISVHYPEFDFEIKLNGVIDRIDLRNGILYIIDYKTGRVNRSDVTLTKEKEDELITDFKYSKAFQLLMYAYMIKRTGLFPNNDIFVGNISFKNLESGFMGFRNERNDTPSVINEEIDSFFEEKLKTLLIEIFDKDIPFVQKEV